MAVRVEQWDKSYRQRSRWWRLLCAHRVKVLHATLGLLVLAGVVALVWGARVYRRNQAWAVAPLPAQQAEDFAQLLLREAQPGEQDGAVERGVVLPLYDHVALLGFSLIAELRQQHVALPIEVPHCGDLSPELQTRMSAQDPLVRFYDICQLAANASTEAATVESSADSGSASLRRASRPHKLFCVDLAHCQFKFRGFDIKVLAVVYSRFEEVMLLDADTLFFKSPMVLWDTAKYRATGTLFFHDRICGVHTNLAARTAYFNGDEDVRALHRYVEAFDVAPYSNLSVVERHEAPPNLSAIPFGVELGFQPSEFLLRSHSWHHRAGHQMDSSVMLWSKKRQPRATAILASFIAHNGLPAPPSYGDKELFWLACELAETAYAFSDYAVGAIGWNLLASDGKTKRALDSGVGASSDKAREVVDLDTARGTSVLCGDAMHYYPEKQDGVEVQEPMYTNNDHILDYGDGVRTLYYTEPRAADFYPGSVDEHKLPLNCPFDVTPIVLGPEDVQLFTDRLRMYEKVADWLPPSEWWLFFW